ncbi:hypothetical protein ACFQO7_06570 [Catellatospora aurea]|uniref:Uncharacterized protein n=1 Tax=Catellatospora aurea TaxID=1337874 RepID=A0ABW2GQF1_9ACTN
MTPHRRLLAALLLATASLTACAESGSPAPAAAGASAGAAAQATPGTATESTDDCATVKTAMLIVSMRTAGVAVAVTQAEQGVKTPRAGLDEAAATLDMPLTILDEALTQTAGEDLKVIAGSIRTEVTTLQQALRSGTDPAAAQQAVEKYTTALEQRSQVLKTRCP